MKRSGILNAQLAGLIAALGHRDTFLIGDAGLPIPAGVPVVDLALCGGVPTFRQTLDAVLGEAVVESYLLAQEIHEKNPALLAYMQECMAGIPVSYVPHETFKERTAHVKFAIRTGEFTPYPNVILTAGVAFPA